jgi:hypothetical protein
MHAYQHHPPVRVLLHIKRLDDALGDFLVRVTCPCRWGGAMCDRRYPRRHEQAYIVARTTYRARGDGREC